MEARLIRIADNEVWTAEALSKLVGQTPDMFDRTVMPARHLGNVVITKAWVEANFVCVRFEPVRD